MTEEESRELIRQMDQLKWNKMLNRRVQHYGFEFKYGTNNVNADDQMGTFPEFFDFLKPRFERILSTLTLDEADFVQEVSHDEHGGET